MRPATQCAVIDSIGSICVGASLNKVSSPAAPSQLARTSHSRARSDVAERRQVQQEKIPGLVRGSPRHCSIPQAGSQIPLTRRLPGSSSLGLSECQSRTTSCINTRFTNFQSSVAGGGESPRYTSALSFLADTRLLALCWPLSFCETNQLWASRDV